MDYSRPALVLMRIIAAATSLFYGVLRIFYDDRSPLFGAGAGDPVNDLLPYATNPSWARFVIIITIMVMGYILFMTLWSAFQEYVLQGVETHTARWSVVIAMVFASMAGVYYSVVAILTSPNYTWLWPVSLASIWIILTIYEVKQHDRYIA